MSRPPHHTEHGFRNIHPGPSSDARGVLRWMLRRKPAPWPELPDAGSPPPGRPGPGEIGVTFINHATFLLQIGGVALLTDPMWSYRASPVPLLGPRRVRKPGQPIAALPPVRLVLQSHCHYDHLDLPTLRRLRRHFDPDVVAPLGHRRLLAAAGLRRVAELDWWESVEAHGLRITAVPARHFSARTPFDRNRRLWGGFAIEGGGARVLFAGDSGWGTHFGEIGARLGPFDLALLPIGAYDPRAVMRSMHVDPSEAVAAHLAVGARRSIGMHFGTFAGLTDEPIDEPERKLAEAAARAGLAPDVFTTLACGETRFLPAARVRQGMGDAPTAL